MKLQHLAGWSSALLLSATIVHAQETNDNERINKQLKQMQETLERQEKMIHEQQAQIEELKKQVMGRQTNAAPTLPPEGTTADQMKELKDKVEAVSEAQKKVRPNEFNPAIGVVGETVFSAGTRGSGDTGSDRPGGFDVFQRSVELNVAGAVDPFAKGYIVANASADSATGEATFGIEEAAIQTTSLPGNLELKGGRFFGEFGKLSYIHDHELPFVNRPLVLNQFIGGESRTDGLQINWLPPIPHFVSLTAGFGNGFGGDSPLNNPGTFRRLGGFNYFGRLSTYFDVTPNIQLETGISGLINPSTEDRGGVLAQPNGRTLTEKARRVTGLDFKLSWVPLQNNQFRRLDWGTEVLYSDSRFLVDPDGSLNPAELSGDEFKADLGAFGMYSYVSYKWHRQWSAGLLVDWVQNAQNRRDETFAVSPNLTWALSHWNQLRLQYTHTEHNSVSLLRPDDAVYLQWAWIIGSHEHGWQQR
jgi:hypothetical protein